MIRTSEAAPLVADAFDFFRDELKRRVGIAIAGNKSEMISGRLRKRLLELKLSDLDAYAAYLKSLPEQHAEWEAFVNSLTTNKTDFFREPEHFHMLQDEIIPEWQKRQAMGSFDVWCAASSTGEEPYTISMVLKRALRPLHLAHTIHSTDIDSDVLERARNGVYLRAKFDEIPVEYRQDAIALGTGAIDKWMKIRSPMREGMSFGLCNLVKPPHQLPRKFDVVFCRNVLIYFTPETIATVVQGLYDAAKPGAYLLIGHSESLHNITTSWQYVKPSVYRKKG